MHWSDAREIPVPRLVPPPGGLYRPDQMRHLYLQFNPLRGRVDYERREPRVGVVSERDRHIADLTELIHAGPQAERSIQWREMGERIHFVRYVLLLDDGRAVAFETVEDGPGDDCPNGKSTYKARLIAEGEAVLMTSDAYRRELERERGCPSRGTPEERRARSLFIDIDLGTHPQLVEPGGAMAQAHALLASTLDCRVRDRAFQFAQTGRCPDPTNIAPNEIVLLDAVAVFLGTTFDEHGFDAQQVAEAFEMFANGQLRWRLSDGQWATQPSSGWFFLFGELALAAMQRQPSGQWPDLACGMIRAQRIFMSAYERDPAFKGFRAYSACGFRMSGQFDERAKRELRRTYASRQFHDLQKYAACNALNAFPEFGVV